MLRRYKLVKIQLYKDNASENVVSLGQKNQGKYKDPASQNKRHI